jgi:hypothetical protein
MTNQKFHFDVKLEVCLLHTGTLLGSGIKVPLSCWTTDHLHNGGEVGTAKSADFNEGKTPEE